jgi:hypothetical protein
VGISTQGARLLHGCAAEERDPWALEYNRFAVKTRIGRNSNGECLTALRGAAYHTALLSERSLDELKLSTPYQLELI